MTEPINPRSLHDLTDHELRDLLAAAFAEMERRDGATTTATWTALQADRLHSLDGCTE